MRRNAITDAWRGPARIAGRMAIGAALSAPAAAADPAPALQEARITARDVAELEALRGLPVTLDHGVRQQPDGRFVQPVIAERSVLEALLAQGLEVEVVRGEHRRGPPPDDYRDPDEGGALLRDLAARSDRVGHAVLGTSVEGRAIEGVWMGRPPEAGAPVFRVLGAHHGDEWSSFELSLAIAETLLALDGTDPAVTAWLDASTVWIVPYVNPDGVLAGTRYNANFVDLNRNYDYEWTDLEFAAGPHPFSEPETRAVRAAFYYDPPLTGLSMHSGAVNIGYVWNWTLEPADDLPVIEDLAWEYAAASTAEDFWVTNGAAWYVTHGDTNDWSYGRFGALDYTVELTSTKSPPSSDIAEFVAAHLDASLAFLELAPDLTGHVIDAATGEPVSARLRLLDDAGEPRSAWFTTDPETGAFHRLSTPEATRIEVLAPGWAPLDAPLDASEALELPLERAGLVAGRVSPTVLAGAGTFQLPDAFDGSVVLHRTGHPPVLTLASGGAVTVGELAAGAWSVELGDGTVLPHALLVAGEGLAALGDITVDGDLLILRGSGFAAGSRAWALQGEVRSHEPLRVLEESVDELVIDIGPIPSDALADVLILTAGAHLAVSDVRGPVEGDGIRPGRSWLAGGAGCACVTAADAGAARGRPPGTRARSAVSMLSCLLLLFAVRRRSS